MDEPFLQQTRKALSYFEDNYDYLVAHRLDNDSKRINVPALHPENCRYCKRSKVQGATYKKVAHALPELLGNKWLFAKDECDDCNDLFARLCEDHLAKYLGVSRTLMQIKGKEGVPATKNRGGSKIFRGDTGLEIHQIIGNEIASIDFDAKTIKFDNPRDSYVPLGVYKSFAKMALAVLPGDEVGLSYLPSAICNPSHSEADFPFKPLYLWTSFAPGPLPYPGLRLALLKRKPDVSNVPGYIFVLAFGSYCFQIALPSLPLDLELGEFTIQFFPMYIIANALKGPPVFGREDLASNELLKGQVQKMSIAFEGYTKTNSSNSDSDRSESSQS